MQQIPVSNAREDRDWCAAFAQLVHPVRVAILEAFNWIERPLAASDLEKMLDSYSLSLISLHIRYLGKVGLIEEVGLVDGERGFKRRQYYLAQP